MTFRRTMIDGELYVNQKDMMQFISINADEFEKRAEEFSNVTVPIALRALIESVEKHPHKYQHKIP